MRIIGGTFGGRKFTPPADNWPTRPTTDVSKEALFNILENRIDFENTKVLDLFCGTGNHGYEFASRGCKDITSVDQFAPAVKFIQNMITELGIDDKMRVVKSDAFKYMESCGQQYDYIFAGPPYPLKTLNTIPNCIFANNLLREDGLFVLEHNPDHNFTKHPHFKEARKYGQTIFAFFQ